MRIPSTTLWLVCISAALASPANYASTLTPSDVTAPFAVQPFAGLAVSGGTTQSFFSDLSALTFPGPGIVNILGNIQAFDSMGDSISAFGIAAVAVTQSGLTLMPQLENFILSAPTTYTSTLNSNQATLVPGALNLAFAFTSDPSFQYSYVLTTTGIPDGGFLLYDDVEGASIPEPVLLLPVGVLLGVMMAVSYWWRPKRESSRVGQVGPSELSPMAPGYLWYGNQVAGDRHVEDESAWRKTGVCGRHG